MSKNKNSISALLPLLVLFALAILSRSSTFSETTIADESKFYSYAEHITQGFYTNSENPLLKEGPGYPLYLAIPAALKLPFFWARGSNIILLFLACCYLFLILKRYISPKAALLLTYLFALYPPMLRWANLMYAESLMLLLLLGFSYHFICWFHKAGNYKRHLVFAILFLGFLALTKIIFVYVIIVALVVHVLLLFFPKVATNFQLKRTALVFIGALALTAPYVGYTYQLTGKFFYLGTHGGSILYHRATPFENEFGNHFSTHQVQEGEGPKTRASVNVNLDQLRENHAQLYREIESLSYIQQDSVFRERAIENMRKYPKKYVENTVANLSRILFHFPFSYRIQNPRIPDPEYVYYSAWCTGNLSGSDPA
jgi:hypothetical protein